MKVVVCPVCSHETPVPERHPNPWKMTCAGCGTRCEWNLDTPMPNSTQLRPCP